MFSWLRTPRPLETAEMAWTERCMIRLADQFGLDVLRDASFLIPAEYAAAFDGSEAHAVDIFDDVCEAMSIAPSHLRFEIVDDGFLPDSCGHYDRSAGPIVRVRASLLGDPCRLVATIAHEASHHLLLGGGIQRGDEPDLEPTTDLLPVFFGYGIFMANATVRFRATHAGTVETWSISGQGYLPSRVFGYALALAAAFRGENRPRWAAALRPDAKEPYQLATRRLNTCDSLFHPDTYVARMPPPTTADLMHQIGHPSATFRFDGLVRLEERFSHGARLPMDELERLAELVRDRDIDVAAAAVRALGASGGVSSSINDELQRAVWLPRVKVRAAAIRALGRLGEAGPEFVDSLARLSGDVDSEIAGAAAEAAAYCGRRAPVLATPLLRLLRRAVIDADTGLARTAARALTSVTLDALAAVDDFFAADPELRTLAADALRSASDADRSESA
jgi:hypothetical protein